MPVILLRALIRFCLCTSPHRRKIKASDKYLVLSTCREEDETIRSNLYLRQIPDSEMKDFLAKHGDQLNYVATRGQE